jgi:signal transduction histidine kinase
MDAAIPTPRTLHGAVNPRSGQWPLRLLRAGLHLLMAALLALAAVRAVADHTNDAAAVVAVAALMAAVYTAGATLPRVRASRTVAIVWLGGLSAVWLALLALTADGVWLAFPLFLLQLHLLPPRWGVAVVTATTAAAIAGFAAHRDTLTAAAVIGPSIGAAVAVAGVLGYQALYRESERRRALIDELRATRDELAAAEHAAGVAAERERLAREIHDTLAQGLSSIQLLLRAAQRALPDGPEHAAAGEHIERARRSAQDNLAEARRFVRALAPAELEHGSLPAALRHLCATTAEHSDLAVDFHLSGTPTLVTTPYETALLRIAQSALANTVQHAHAARATVTLTYMDTGIALDIVDDGAGFDTEAAARVDGDGGFGLAAMRARVRALGGALSVESAPGQGTALAASFPRRHTPDPARA